jgi:hypothetical protein
MPFNTPLVGEGRQPSIAIPSRGSSICRTSNTGKAEDRTMTARCGPVEENSDRLSFLKDDPNAANPRVASSRPVRRTHSPSRNSTRLPKVQHWAGLTRSVRNWDGLRKVSEEEFHSESRLTIQDAELWMPDGDCAVHLYARGASRRGPSFCVPLRALRQKGCSSLLDVCYAQAIVETSTGPREQRIYTFDNLNRESLAVELYIPAPDNASREESFDWHLATRNFFAFVLGKPLVGRQMGQAYVDLYERMKTFRSDRVDNHYDFLQYAEAQGYRDLVECTDYALASLYYAERYKLRDVWIDAFAHCVGMNDSIGLSPEYTAISRLSKALITRAYLEEELHLGRVAKALRTFLEDDLSPAYLGIAAGARHHLHRFQRFLHLFYVEKYGYWPPPKTSSFPKALYKSLFYDFKSLYDLLVDSRSNGDITSQSPASGGICVLQTIDHFDKRHNFTAQPHPLPLLPTALGQTTTRSLSSASHHKKTQNKQAAIAALAAATNSCNIDSERPRIVQAYLDFEKLYAANPTQREDKVTAVDARKVDWLLIYGTLQYLTSVLRAPDGVRDVESPDYPLCCLLVAGKSSWEMATPLPTPPVSNPASPLRTMNEYFGEAPTVSSSSIEPDCQREDYFASNNPVRSGNAHVSGSAKTMLPFRQPSTRSLGPLSSFSPRSSRRSSLRLKPTPSCAIIVRGYGDGLNQTTTQASSQIFVERPEPNVQEDSDAEPSWLKPQAPPAPVGTIAEVRGPARIRTPLLLTTQLEQFTRVADPDEADDAMSRSDSTGSKGSSVWTDEGSAASSKSSANGERQSYYKASTAEHSGLLGGLVSVDGTRVSLELPEFGKAPVASQADIHPLLRKPSVQHGGFQFDFGAGDFEATSSLDAADSIGMAFSETPATPHHTTTPAPLLRTMSLTSEKKPYVFAADVSQPASVQNASPRKKNRSSDIFSGLITSPSELRDLYNNTIKRRETATTSDYQYGDLSTSASSDAHPPTVTKTSHAIKTPALRSRVWHDDAKEEKKERRMSSFWRR